MVAPLLATLSTEQDLVWPNKKWPRMKFKEGLVLNAKGGHGPIRYYISDYVPNKSIEFTFTQPSGFHGTHDLKLIPRGKNTEVKHTINMLTRGKATILWLFAIRWLHDALLEDALDKVEGQFSEDVQLSKWNPWVRFLRWVAK